MQSPTFRIPAVPTTLSTAIALALAFAPAIVLAQDTPDEPQATTLDRIEVTGTRIRQVDIETEQPVLIISRAQIERQGFQSVADILQNITAAGTPAISRAQPLLTGENVGGQFISMRNLNPNRTLILVNGRRLGQSTSGLQDVSLIPASAVERMEVLKDGASSLYGSDAIGGVINIITRSGFEGALGNVYYGQYSQGDGAIERGDFVLGVTGDRGSVTVAVEHRKEDDVMAADRPFSAFPQGARHPTRGWTTVSQWGVINLPAALGGNRVLDMGADWRDIANYHAQDTDTGAPGGPSGGAGSTADKSNTNEQTQLRTPLESTSLFVNAVYEFSDAVRLRADMLYTSREGESQVAGYPYQSAVFDTPLSVDSYYNPIGNHHGFADPQAVHFWRRTWEMPRIEIRQLETWRFSTTLEGSFDWADRYFDWDVGYMYTRDRRLRNDLGQLNIDNVAAAVGPSFLNPTTGRVECGTPDNPIPFGVGPGSCIPWNPLIPFGRVGDGGLTNDPDLQAFLSQETRARGETATTMLSANLSGQLLSLPAGDLAFAVGIEHRRDEGEFVPDPLAVNGRSTNLASGPTQGSISVDEVYLELFVPILRDLPGARDLSLTAATRYSDYDVFGDTTNSKFGFRWKPVDSVLVRGTWAEGFRAPTISNLFGGGSQTFSNYTDPCDTLFGASASSPAVRARCAQDIADADSFRQLAQGFNQAPGPNAQTPVAFFAGSNPDLQPETSISKTLGVVWSPEFAPGLNLALDWWSIRVENTIVADTPTQMLNDCYIEGIASRCRNFTRDPARGFVNSLSFGSRNAGYEEMEGFDFDASYRRETGIGSFTVNWQTTYTTKDEFKTTNDPDVLPQQAVGFAGTNTGTFRIKSNLNLGWESGDWSANWGARYYSSMRETCLHATLFPEECSNPDYIAANPGDTRPINRVGSNTFHDLEIRVQAPWNATIGIGALNVFNHFGPPMYTSPSANVAYQGQFDIGRFVYMKYQQRF